MPLWAHRALGLGLLGSATVAAALVCGTAPVHATSPGNNGRIAFTRSFADGNTDIYTMRSQGGGEQQLTTSPGLDDEPAWRATGDELLFTTERRGKPEIWRMTAQGDSETALALGTQVGSASWSATTQIAYETNSGEGYEIYATDAQGTPRKLTTNGAVSDRAPEWSPDGKQIAFWSARTGNRDIYSMNADGSGVSRLTSNAASDRDPTWSPDGQRIAFESGRDGNAEIYVMDRLGSGANGAVNLTKDPSDDREPAWSPDGKKIAFVSSRDGDDEIFVMNADGTNVQQLTKNDVPDRRPAWQPLGGVEVFPSAAGARGLTTTQVAVAVTGGTVVAAGVTVLICGGGNLIPILGQGFFIACGLAISVIVEGGTTIALISKQRKSFRVPSAARVPPASTGVIAVPHAFAAPAPTNDACKSLRSQTGCERLKGAIRGYQDAVALVAAMSEGVATTALRYAAAGGNAANQALQRAAAKVYWGQLDLTTRRERAAAQALAEVLRTEGVNVTLSAAQSHQVAADLGQLRGVPSSVVARLRAGGLTTNQIESGISTAAANLPAGELDLQSFLRRPIATGAYRTAYRTLSIDEVGYIMDSFRRQGIVSSRLASALTARLKSAKAAGSVLQRRQLMRAFVADVRKGLTSEPYSSFLQSAAYPAAGAA